MKKMIYSITLLIAVFAAGTAFGQEAKTDMADGQGKFCPIKGADQAKCPKCGKDMGSMSKPSLVATSDGGVVLLKGCTLTKFDKNLKVIKEVQLECGMSGMGMGQKVMGSAEGCPIMKMRAMKSENGPNDAQGAAQEAK